MTAPDISRPLFHIDLYRHVIYIDILRSVDLLSRFPFSAESSLTASGDCLRMLRRNLSKPGSYQTPPVVAAVPDVAAAVDETAFEAAAEACAFFWAVQ